MDSGWISDSVSWSHLCSSSSSHSLASCSVSIRSLKDKMQTSPSCLSLIACSFCFLSSSSSHFHLINFVHKQLDSNSCLFVFCLSTFLFFSCPWFGFSLAVVLSLCYYSDYFLLSPHSSLHFPHTPSFCLLPRTALVRLSPLFSPSPS